MYELLNNGLFELWIYFMHYVLVYGTCECMIDVLWPLFYAYCTYVWYS